MKSGLGEGGVRRVAGLSVAIAVVRSTEMETEIRAIDGRCCWMQSPRSEVIPPFCTNVRCTHSRAGSERGRIVRIRRRSPMRQLDSSL